MKRIGLVKLAQLTPSRVEDFQKKLQRELSRPLARKVLISFKSILKVNKRSHVAANISIERDKREEHVEVGRDLPSNAEVKRLIEAVKGDYLMSRPDACSAANRRVRWSTRERVARPPVGRL